MKRIFLGILVLLALASVGTVLSLPEARSPVPILYWVTDPNPARLEQIRLFHQWLIRNGHTQEVVLQTQEDVEAFRARPWPEALVQALEDTQPEAAQLLKGQAASLPMTVQLPVCLLRLDTANRDVSKQIIQGVSGVAGDIMDITWGAGMQQFHAIGLLRDVTEPAKQLGFDPSKTYPAIEPEITLDGRQYMFPCNVTAPQYWVNVEVFERFSQPLPPKRWTFDEFEQRGRAFVEAANQGLSHQQHFFAASVDRRVMHRSLVLDVFNETLTRCTLDDPRYAEVLERIYRWTYEDHLLPSAAELASFATEAGYGGASAQLFASGHVAMMISGRYMLIQFREFSRLRIEQGQPPLKLTVVELPHGGFPNGVIGTRAAAVYAGSRHPELAQLFLAYLASEPYNMQIVHDADALPPNPIYTTHEDFVRPPQWPNEWGSHEPFAEAAQTIAIASSNSPFVLSATVTRIDQEEYDAFMNNIKSASAAGRDAAARINAEIQRTLKEDPSLQQRYEEALALQERIDAYRQAGRPIPLDWIQNPFHRRYYQAMGWVEQPAGGE
ncbi:MAG TPA: extracellular solute-binding protein [Phycisphaeraceae bacterium]